ncbi:Spore germination protein [Desulfosporosinus orientis DSM 765]|uniref:Spore germination protein n=1 Tax=Desulfosporosinus orientis (strain ATCC 19365 / DSM 765 / NCIMB 8382 / VKM B-1628 / Singapore I) TaxID=768706 RepID=G7W7I2_DESOD|nr:GerAB/ArcD/ProY family transporter [Desulfosporosinus orientis]AET65901.1 Spore germination protein [Desulfosporosinus orientis DSM 765]
MGQPSKISARQATALLTTLILSTGVILIPAISMARAGLGAWLSTLISTLAAIPLLLVYSCLSTFAPNLRLTDRLTLLVGPRLGRTLSLVFSLFLLFTMSTVIHEGGLLVRVIFLPETPAVVITAGLCLLILYGAWLGPQALARMNTLYLPLFFMTMFVLSVGAFSEPHWYFLWPPWDKGLSGLISAAVIPLAWLGEISLLLFMSPDISDLNIQRWRIPLYATLISGGFFTLNSVIALITFGPNLGSLYAFPVLQIGRTFGENMRGIDALIMSIWVVGVFQKLALWLHYSVQEIGYIFKLQNSKALLPPMIILQNFLGLSTLYSITELFHYLDSFWPYLALATFEGIIPIGLFLVWLKYSNKKRQ